MRTSKNNAHKKTPKARVAIKKRLKKSEKKAFIEGKRAELKYNSTATKGKKFYEYLSNLSEKRSKLINETYKDDFIDAIRLSVFPPINSDEYVYARVFIDENKKLWKTFKVLEASNKRKKKLNKKSLEIIKLLNEKDEKIDKLIKVKISKKHEEISGDLLEELIDAAAIEFKTGRTTNELDSIVDCCILVICHLISSGSFSAMITKTSHKGTNAALKEHVPALINRLSDFRKNRS